MGIMSHMQVTLAQSGEQAVGVVLVSWWKPIVLVALFGAWAWVVATIYDKDANKWLLKRQRWNLIHAVAGLAAWAAALAAPAFIVALPLFAAILFADLSAYWIAHNKSERVPERERWRFSLERFKQAKTAKEKAAIVKGLTLAFRGPKGVVAAPERETPEFDIRYAAETIINDAIEARAMRFDIAPAGDKRYATSFIIDGVRKTGESLPAAQAVAVIDFFKAVAGLDVNDRRRRLSADFRVERETARRDIRVSTAGDARGQRLQGVFEPEKQVSLAVDDLGLLPKQREALDQLVKDERGVVLLATPPLSGRTTLLYAILRAHDAYLSNIHTVEIQPEAYIDGIRHNRFDPREEGADYATTVRSILRRDPDIVAVAEMPDEATAQVIATVADHERCRVYLCMRADGAESAIRTFAQVVGDAKTAADALHGVVAQRLIRRLCENCKAEYAPTPDILRRLGLPADKVKRLHKKGGQVLIKGKAEVCPACGGVGYFGQTGLHEVFPISDEEREAIAAQDWSTLRTALRKQRLPWIRDAAMTKLVQGITSVEEVVRATAQPARKKSSSKPAAEKPAQQAPPAPQQA